MPRTFNGTTDNLRTALGAINGTVTAVTFAAIIRRGANGAWHSVMELVDSGGSNILALELSAGNAIDFNANMASGSASSFTVQTTDGQVLLAVTKATGTVTPRMHKYVYSSDTWTHSAGSLTVANPSGTAASVRFAQWETTDFYQGDLVAAGMWNRDLTDTEVEQLAMSLTGWHAVTPAALWVFDQQATGQTVPDLTGGGANQNAITGTTVASTSPVVWSYGHDVSAPHSVPAAGGSTTPISVAGSMTPAGALVRQTGHLTAGSVTPTGGATKRTSRTLAGTTTPTGAILKLLGRLMVGGTTPASSLATIRTRLLAVAGGIAPAGAVAKLTGKPVAGTTTPAGAMTRRTAKTMAGSATPTGVVASIRTRLLAIAGSVTPAGQLARQTGKAVGGAVAPAGSLTRSLARRLTGSVTPTGGLSTARTKLLALLGGITPTGLVTKRTARMLGGTVTPTGTPTKRIGRMFAGATNPMGAVLKLVGHLLAGSVTPVGAVATNTNVAPIVTPPDRTITVPADPRSTTVAADSRTVVVPPDPRTEVV